MEGAPLNNGKFVNPKLITWDGEIGLQGASLDPRDIGSCYAMGVLKLGACIDKDQTITCRSF